MDTGSAILISDSDSEEAENEASKTPKNGPPSGAASDPPKSGENVNQQGMKQGKITIKSFAKEKIDPSRATTQQGFLYLNNQSLGQADEIARAGPAPVKLVDINSVLGQALTTPMPDSQPPGEKRKVKTILVPENVFASFPFLGNGQQVLLINFTDPAQRTILQQPTSSRNIFKAPKEPKPKPKPKEKPATSHRCLELRKTGFKLDLEGFTFFDRLGFFKAEEKRARRCANLLNVHIKVRAEFLNSLVAFRAVSKKLNDCAEVKKIRRRRKPKPKTPKYNLKEVKVLLCRADVDEYLNRKKSQQIKCHPLREQGYEVSERKIPPFYSKRTTLSQLVKCKGHESITFVDDNYVHLVDQVLPNEKMFYINKNNVTTALYMELFPSFRKAVQSRQVKIVNQRIFNKFFHTCRKSKQTAVKTFVAKRVGDKENNTAKAVEFCRRVADFHLLHKTQEQDTKCISAEHNYVVKKN